MSDLDIIKELEQEIGQKIPVVGLDDTIPENADRSGQKVNYENLNRTSGFGLFVDSGNQVLGASFFLFHLKSIPPSVFKFKRLKKLSLRGNQLKSLSNRISSLTELEVLVIDGNKLTSLSSEITQLTNLSMLYLEGNQLTSLPPGITQLTNLSSLYLDDNQLTSLPSGITQLTNLSTLGLSGNQLTSLPPAITQLTNLSTLFLDRNGLTSLPPEITELTNLSELSLHSNQLTSLPPEITQLTNLSALSLSGNQLTSLPPEIGELANLSSIHLIENPLVTPPSEVAEQGIEAIRDYFEQIEKEKGQTQYLFESKLLIIGDGGTGKTSFRKKVKDPGADMPKKEDTTFGIEVDKWNFKTPFTIDDETSDVDFNVNLWDFGGQKIYRGTHQIFFTDKSCYVLVADTREQGTDFSYWLNTVQQLAGDGSRVLILLNKKYGHEVKFDETGFKSHFSGLIKDVFEIDLKNDAAKIPHLQSSVKRHLTELPGIGAALPPSWIKIRGDLLREEGNYISFDRFREICKDHNITDPGVIRTLSGYFSRIGAFTHYIDDPVLQDRVYLNSDWLVHTVYEVLDNRLVKAKKGRLTADEIKDIWNKEVLIFEFEKLTKLMHNFGLMYRINGSENYVVPEYLPTEQPYERWPHAKKPGILHFTYKFDKYMPLGIMSRIIVSLHRHIKNHDHVWHRGVNVELNGTYGEVVESYGAENSFQIRISGHNKIELLATIREHFAQVLEPFRNLNYQQMVPCVCDECKAADSPGFHDYERVLRCRQKGVTSQCSISDEPVDPHALLRIIKEEEDASRYRQGESKVPPIVIQNHIPAPERAPEPPKEEKPWYQKLWGVALVVLALIGGAAGIAEIMDSDWVKKNFFSDLPPQAEAETQAAVTIDSTGAQADGTTAPTDSLSTSPDSTASDTTTTSP